MRITCETPHHKTKPNMANQKSAQTNINFARKEKGQGLCNSAYAMLFLAPLMFENPSLKAQATIEPEQYISVQLGENQEKEIQETPLKGNKKNDLRLNRKDSTIYSDGKIGDFKQGKFNDCALLSAAKAISLTPEGKKIIQNIIKPQPDGSFEVENCGDSDSKTYTVTKKDFFQNDSISTLDDDVKILEIGFKKYCDANRKIFKFSPTEAIRLLTCTEPDYSVSTEDSTKAFIDTVGDKRIVDQNTNKVRNLFSEISKMDSEERKNLVLICSTKDENAKYGLFADHAYYVTDFKIKKDENGEIDGIIELNNPHCTDCEPIKLDMNQFLKSMSAIDYLELN